MSDTKFTAGTSSQVWWGNEEYPYPLLVLADDGGMWIARDGTTSSHANARLIAAAPALYEALEGLFRHTPVDDLYDNCAGDKQADGQPIPEYKDTMAAIDAARAALAKATGSET